MIFEVLFKSECETDVIYPEAKIFLSIDHGEIFTSIKSKDSEAYIRYVDYSTNGIPDDTIEFKTNHNYEFNLSDCTFKE